MGKLLDIIPVSDLRQDTAKIMKHLQDSKEPIIITQRGRAAQFLSALAYIRRDKPSAAVRFRNRTETVLRRLENFQESGRVIPEFPELAYKEVIISSYRFFYRIKGDLVWIVAVWHSTQLPKEPAP